MIVQETKEKEVLIEMLKDVKKIFLVGCGDCATACEAGGEKDLDNMKMILEAEGKKVTGMIIPDTSCHIPDVKNHLKKHAKEIESADSIGVMSCGAGVQSVADVYETKVVFPLNNPLFLGNTERFGQHVEYCSACGECRIDKFGAICPITRCYKGILNGPCGGVNNGMCEVGNDTPCAWVQAYDRLEKQNRLDNMKEVIGSKKWSAHLKPMRHLNPENVKKMEKKEAKRKAKEAKTGK
jgi:ferredoxin